MFDVETGKAEDENPPRLKVKVIVQCSRVRE
jgi:hypothetical protein